MVIKGKKIQNLIQLKDTYFNFKNIVALDSIISDEIFYSSNVNNEMEYKTLQPFYQDLTFEETFNIAPNYIISKINSDRMQIQLSEDELQKLKENTNYTKLLQAIESQEDWRAEMVREREEDSRYDYYDDTDYERETYYALGGDDYDSWRSGGGNLDDMMDGMGF